MSYRIKVIEGRASAAGKEVSRDSGYKIESEVTRVGAGSRCDLRVEIPGVKDDLLFQIEYRRIDGHATFQIIPQVDDALEFDGRPINVGDEIQWMLGSRLIIYDRVVLELVYKKSSRSKPKEPSNEENSNTNAMTSESWRRRQPTSSKRRAEQSNDDFDDLFTQGASTIPQKADSKSLKEQSSTQQPSPESSKQRIQLLVIIFCFGMTGLLILSTLLSDLNDGLNDDEARKVLTETSGENSELVKLFDMALWAEKGNEEEARILYPKVKDAARVEFKEQLTNSNTSQKDKEKVHALFSYLDAKIDSLKAEEEE